MVGVLPQVEDVKRQCLPGGLNLPLLEEYDYHNDSAIPDIPIALLPTVRHRPYQEKSLTKLLGNGALVLPSKCTCLQERDQEG